jgi:Holliday junction DNA helicase RuvB
LSEFTGQDDIKESLSIAIEAAKQRGDALDHCLFAGPPGLGKTTLSSIIAKEMGVNIHITSGPVLEKASDLAGLLTSLQENDILFIDEIHRLNRVVEEYLYPAMEDFRLDIMLDSGPAARSVNLPLKHFTLVGATTRSGLLTGPLRDRFGLQYRLELYNEKDIVKILMRSARILGVELSEEAAKILGGRCRGTPRVANRVLRRCRDVAQVRGTGVIDERAAIKTLEMLGIDSEGLDPTDRKILAMMIDKFGGGPVGLGTISAAMGEEPDTLEEVYEPYLIQKGLISRTPRGRVATPNAYRMLHKAIPKSLISEQTELPL